MGLLVKTIDAARILGTIGFLKNPGGTMRLLLRWSVILLPLPGFSFESKPIELYLLHRDGTRHKHAKVYKWDKPTCRRGDDGELLITIKGKHFRDGKLELSLNGSDISVTFTDAHKMGWTVDDSTVCKVQVTENKEVAAVDISGTCFGLVPVNTAFRDLIGTKNIEISPTNPVSCTGI
jgi:hypothetical protein